MDVNLESNFNIYIFPGGYYKYLCLRLLQSVLLTFRQVTILKKDMPTNPLTQPSVGVLIHPLQVTQVQHLKRFDVYDIGTVQEVPANRIYWIFQSLGIVTGTRISKIHFSWLFSGHHLHTSYCKQDRHHCKYPVSQ